MIVEDGLERSPTDEEWEAISNGESPLDIMDEIEDLKKGKPIGGARGVLAVPGLNVSVDKIEIGKYEVKMVCSKGHALEILELVAERLFDGGEIEKYCTIAH